MNCYLNWKIGSFVGELKLCFNGDLQTVTLPKKKLTDEEKKIISEQVFGLSESKSEGK